MLFTMLSMMWVWRLGSWCCVLARAWWALNNKLFIRAVFCAQNYIWCDYVSLYGIVLCLVPVLWLIGILPVPIMVIIIRRLPDIINTRTRDHSDDDTLACVSLCWKQFRGSHHIQQHIVSSCPPWLLLPSFIPRAAPDGGNLTVTLGKGDFI